jgi:hypothetical protein
MKGWQEKSLEIVRIIDFHLPLEWKTDAVRGRVLGAYSRIFYDGRQRVSNEELRKGIEKYRRHLKNALEQRNSFTITHPFPDGPLTEKPLQRLFFGSDDESLKPGGIRMKGPADSLIDMIAECDRILGTEKPIRYPRQTVIRESLDLWKKFTGKNPPRYAIQPNTYSGSKESAPYAITRLLLEISEDCSDVGDFSAMFETVVEERFPNQ